ncbi:MAG: MBL fold metallo-hydrolase [Thermoguttaceae bacterium]|nr:MBL fold metallo-hydrolase [Thermoguttaceae bacterium]
MYCGNIEISTYSSRAIRADMYLLRSEGRMVVIDPICPDAEAPLHEVGKIDFILLTHEHYDHISGVNWFRERFGGVVLCSAPCAEAIVSPRKNLSKYLGAMLDEPNFARYFGEGVSIEPYQCRADRILADAEEISWQGHTIEMFITPGHSCGSVCYLLDRTVLFCGDTLFADCPTCFDFPGGSRNAFQDRTLPLLCHLSPTVTVFPGHGREFVLGDWFAKEQTDPLAQPCGVDMRGTPS